ncbi:hypothetical protein GCM10010413_48420 [Promicromonospora sukumoe]|uniref:Excalibur calcium-binding domain-containing protein n=1 Tax=Promicromonospora sukumoe TaxID=88382 RepID=A0A7W3PFC0_9MICO|nr:hypothetical protein [Promicromonospora sukumoe]MBA8809472.1 hypothetical protein [Promicromonospora sukumoe]
MFRRTIVALVSVLALVLTASVPAQAGTARSTSITARAASDTVAKSKSIVLKGKLTYKTDGRWRALSGRVLTVHFDPAGSAGSRKVATIKTTRTGAYTFKTTASKSGSWTVKFGGKKGSLRADTARDSVCVYTAGRWQCPVTADNPDLDCADIGKTVRITGKDYHRLDADNDGWGCDSYS